MGIDIVSFDCSLMDSEINCECFEEVMLDQLNMNEFYAGQLTSLVSLTCRNFHSIHTGLKYISVQGYLTS